MPSIRSSQREGRPAMRSVYCRTRGRFHTAREHMKSFVRSMTEADSRPGVASISLIHGFPWGDVSEMGAKCLVLADTTKLAERTAQEFGERLVRKIGRASCRERVCQYV